MAELAEFWKTWGSHVLALLSLLLGGGWFKSYFEGRRKQKELDNQRYREILEGFLKPFQGVLKTTHTLFNKLRDDRELSQLEYHPGRLQGFFAGLPDHDPRKHHWKSYIELLHAENSRAVELIDKYYGRIITEQFRVACDKFRVHTKEWKIMWEAVTGSGTGPSPWAVPSDALLADRFPVGLDEALAAEVAEFERRLSGG